MDTEDLQSNPSKEVDISKRNNEFVIPSGEIFQEGQPYLLLCTKRERPRARISATFFRRKRKKPEIQIQMSKLDKISVKIIGHYIYRNHVAPRTTLNVPKDEFPILLNYIEVQRQTKTSIDVLHEATIDGYWNVDGDMLLSEHSV